MKKVLVVIIMLTLLTSCKDKETYEYKSVNTSEALEIMQDSKYQIIDVRSADEYAEGHLKNAINIEYTKVDTTDISKDTVLFVYCRSGKRSKIAAETLLQMGYQVYDLGAFENIGLEKE